MESDAPRLIRRLYRVIWNEPRKKEIEDALVAVSPPALPHLVEALRPNTWSGLLLFLLAEDPACYVVRALGRIGDPRAVDPLISLLRRRDTRLPGPAAQALGRIGDRRAVPYLLSMVRLRGSYTRSEWYAAVRAFTRLAEAEDIPALCDVLNRVSAIRSEESLEKLNAIAGVEVVDRLAELGDLCALPHLLARANAPYLTMDALVSFGPAAIPELLRALHSDLRDADKALLGLICLGKAAIPALLEHVGGPPSRLTSRCAVALSHLGGREPELVPLLLAAIEHSWSRELAFEALALVAADLNDPILRTALPMLRKLACNWHLARNVGLATPQLPACLKALSQIERQTEDFEEPPGGFRSRSTLARESAAGEPG